MSAPERPITSTPDPPTQPEPGFPSMHLLESPPGDWSTHDGARLRNAWQTATPDQDFVVLPRETLFEFLGEMALPPWTDADGATIGSSIDCAPIAERLTAWVNEHDLSDLYFATRPEPVSDRVVDATYDMPVRPSRGEDSTQ